MTTTGITTGALLPTAVARQVAVEGVRFAVYRADPPRRRRTPPVLLLHGVPQTAAIWRTLLPELARDRIVLAPDLKGLGGSEARGPYDTDTLVRELAALVLHEVPGPIDVVGHDWGGSLAIALARARPELVRRLVVVNAPYRKVDLARAWHIPLFSLPVLPEAAFALAGPELVGRMLDYAWRGPVPLEPAVRAHYVSAYAGPSRIAAMLAYYRAATRARLRPHRHTGTAPAAPAAPVVDRALVLWGAADPVLPPAIGDGVVRDLGPNASLLSLPGIGHYTPDEAPELSTAAIAEFLRSKA